MARKSKQLTRNQQEFKKQQNRIKQFVRRAEKRGYIFEDNIVPEMPKRVTKKALVEIKSLKPNKLYGKARAIDYDTGEILTGNQARQLEIQERTRKAQETKRRKKQKPISPPTPLPRESDIIIQNFKNIVMGFPDLPKAIILDWLEKAVESAGADAVAQVLQDGLASGEITYREFAYDLKKMMGSLSRMSDYLNLSRSDKQAIDESMEQYEDWDDIE